uniref:Uncharacterized protein n=1 Tax=Myripristis murdjan TaxID=586833 RepID=A0A667Y7R6_9TELE
FLLLLLFFLHFHLQNMYLLEKLDVALLLIFFQSLFMTLLASPVYEAELVRRPKRPWPVELGYISHSGVRVTLEDGSQWLIHNGSGNGISSDTVVVSDRFMSSKWRVRQRHWTSPGTVSDLVEAGGREYSLWSNNCHQAAERILDLQ